MRNLPANRRISCYLSVFVLVAILCGCATTKDPLDKYIFGDLFYMQDAQSGRSSSWDRTGGNFDARILPPGETLELANIQGAGCIKQIYFTFGRMTRYRDLELRMYWDDESEPSVEVPLADYFGIGHERPRYYQTPLVTVNPSGRGIDGGLGFTSYFPMPFADGARITLTNGGDVTVAPVWFHVNYETFDKLNNGIGRFHAQWRRERATEPVAPEVPLQEKTNLTGHGNYVVLEAKGKGNLAGYFLNMEFLAPGGNHEGDDMVFIDGEAWPPAMHGTGTEEIFGGGAGPNREYIGPWHGINFVANPDYVGKHTMYRFFVPDPIRFSESIKVTFEHGHANERMNDYSSTAFWYQIEPHAPFPELPPAAERRPRMGQDLPDQTYAKYTKLQELANDVMRLYVARGLPYTDDAHLSAMNYEMARQVTDWYMAREYGKVQAWADEWQVKLEAFLDKPENVELMKKVEE